MFMLVATFPDSLARLLSELSYTMVYTCRSCYSSTPAAEGEERVRKVRSPLKKQWKVLPKDFQKFHAMLLLLSVLSNLHLTICIVHTVCLVPGYKASAQPAQSLPVVGRVTNFRTLKKQCSMGWPSCGTNLMKLTTQELQSIHFHAALKLFQECQ